jgi:hypothetical protein
MSGKADIYFYDIELYPNCFMITIKHLETEAMHTIVYHPDYHDKFVPFEKLAALFTDKTKWFVGYNSFHYDDQVMSYVIDKANTLSKKSIDKAITDIYAYSTAVINQESNQYKYRKFINGLDLMKIGRLFKSLKMVAVNLKWHKIQDLPYVFKHKVKVSELSEIIRYNINDVLITEKLFFELRDEINLRSRLSKQYPINLMNEDRSSIANKMLEHFYEKETGADPYVFKKLRTRRGQIPLRSCIDPKITFSTPKLQAVLAEMKKELVTVETEYRKRVIIGSTGYDLAKGGIHSFRGSEIFESTDTHKLIDCDVTSYYPRIMVNLKLKPEHLTDAFLRILQRVLDQRISFKNEMRRLQDSGETDTILYDNARIGQEAMKIVINSIFGKLGDENYWLYDPMAMYRTTINGQLYLLMLIERLEEANIPVIYANTDGITAQVPVELEGTYKAICDAWQTFTGFDLEFAEYQKMILKDVNSYIVLPVKGKPKIKGTMNPERYKELSKAFDKPIVDKAVFMYFTSGIPISETLRNHPDPLDFCMAQKADSTFEIVYYEFNEKKQKIVPRKMQHTNRYLVSNKKGGSLYKEKNGKQTAMVANQTVQIVNDFSQTEQYDINYSYYEKECRKIIDLFEKAQLSLF